MIDAALIIGLLILLTTPVWLLFILSILGDRARRQRMAAYLKDVRNETESSDVLICFTAVPPTGRHVKAALSCSSNRSAS